MKLKTISVRLPAFLFSPWLRWAALAAILLFAGWRSVPPPPVSPNEKRTNPMSKPGGMGNYGTLLPCGHRLSNPLYSSNPDFVCVEGHRFIAVGPEFFPAP